MLHTFLQERDWWRARPYAHLSTNLKTHRLHSISGLRAIKDEYDLTPEQTVRIDGWLYFFASMMAPNV